MTRRFGKGAIAKNLPKVTPEYGCVPHLSQETGILEHTQLVQSLSAHIGIVLINYYYNACRIGLNIGHWVSK